MAASAALVEGAAMLDPVGFWSYTRNDDEHSDGQLSQLRASVGKAIALQCGAEVTLWQDTVAIDFGTDWAANIEQAVGQTTFFIPIVTPHFLKSPYCFSEFKAFRNRMIALGRNDLIFPVQYVGVDYVQAADTVFGEGLAELRRHQWIDFTPLFFSDPKSAEVRKWAGELAASILRALRRPGAPSPIIQVPIEEPQGPPPVPNSRGNEVTQLEQAEATGRVGDEEGRKEEQELPDKREAGRAEVEQQALAGRPNSIASKREQEILGAQHQVAIFKSEIRPAMEKRLSRKLVGGVVVLTLLVIGVAVVSLRLTLPVSPVGTELVNKKSRAETSVNTAPTIPIEEALKKGEEAYTAKDYAQAMSWARIAADQGNAEAQADIGWLYQNGLGFPQDYVQAMSWYRKAADQGHAEAQNHIGWLYQNGLGVPQDYVQAMSWYRKAADQGNAVAQAYIGGLYQNGLGVTRDYVQAMSWYRKAADQGNAVAQAYIGVLYQNGWGVPQDYGQAMSWYRKAADQGFAGAQNNIGWLYQNGWGVPQDYAIAMSWYRKAADQGFAMAQAHIGELYENGQDVAQDYALAMSWYRKAADQGNATAQNRIGWLYYNGYGVAQDYGQAMAWWRKAADQGYADAQNNIGWMYDYGLGVKQDYALAMSWYLKAANQGYAEAHVNIGALFEEGNGVKKNAAKAKIWYRKAADQGNEEAKAALKRLSP
jgi:TPR repeat protein